MNGLIAPSVQREIRRGNISLALAQDGFEVTGVDFSPTAIEWAKGLDLETSLGCFTSWMPCISPSSVSSSVFESGLNDETALGRFAALPIFGRELVLPEAIFKRQLASFSVADLGQPWPFEDDSFDVVIDANCLHFFHGEGRGHFLAEARRVLKTDGREFDLFDSLDSSNNFNLPCGMDSSSAAPQLSLARGRLGGAFLLSTIVNQPEEKDWEFLGYDSLTRTSTQNGVTMNYYATVPELLGALEGAGFGVSYSEITNVDHELIWLVAK